MNHSNKDFYRLTISMGRTRIGFGGRMLVRNTKKIANKSIVSSWAMVFFHIQRTKIYELQTLIVNEKEKMILVK
jgi:hypothetical protein